MGSVLSAAGLRPPDNGAEVAADIERFLGQPSQRRRTMTYIGVDSTPLSVFWNTLSVKLSDGTHQEWTVWGDFDEPLRAARRGAKTLANITGAEDD